MKKFFKVLGVWALMFAMLVTVFLLIGFICCAATLNPVVGLALVASVAAAVLPWVILS